MVCDCLFWVILMVCSSLLMVNINGVSLVISWMCHAQSFAMVVNWLTNVVSDVFFNSGIFGSLYDDNFGLLAVHTIVEFHIWMRYVASAQIQKCGVFHRNLNM